MSMGKGQFLEIEQLNEKHCWNGLKIAQLNYLQLWLVANKELQILTVNTQWGGDNNGAD